jgi:trehalose 6-phosphate phosphatase
MHPDARDGRDLLRPVRRHLRAGGRVWLFLDYDGTLVPIAPTPAEAQPDPALLGLLGELVRDPRLRPVVLSGRPLADLQAMLPVPGLILAGTYGLEVYGLGAEVRRRASPGEFRPVVARVKSAWTDLVHGRHGFLIEDKGLAVALHARWAEPAEAETVLTSARSVAGQTLPPDSMRILGGDRFLEVAPTAAHKGRTIEWLLAQLPWPGALAVAFGDDDKDAEAFAVLRQLGGLPIAVGQRYTLPEAAGWLATPDDVRDCLRELLEG